MSEVNIRAEIKTILETVTDLGIVHDYDRWTVRPEQFVTLYKDANNKINACSIHRRSCAEERETTGPRYRVMHEYIITCYYGLDDSEATAKTFNAILEDIKSAFRATYDLNGKAQKHDLVQIDTIADMMFSDYMVHYAELSLLVYEEING